MRTTFTIDKATKTITAKSGNIEDSKTFTGDFFPSSSVYPVVLFAFWTAWNNTLRGYGKGKIYSFKYERFVNYINIFSIFLPNI